jgi:predicted RNA binding protein YcfA (HicA-like mRNA interferase family)
MPRKIRQLKADLQKAGFVWRPGKGSHTVWTHPLLPADEVTLAGHDGDDVQHYQERDVREMLAKLRRAEGTEA